MKKIIVFLVALCAVCGSAFAEVTISDWGIYRNNHNAKPIVYEGLIDDIAPTGFTVHASSEMWEGSQEYDPVIWLDGESPWAGFYSNTVSPGLMINYNDTVSFAVNITGFEDLVFSSRFLEEPTYTDQDIQIVLWSTDNKSVRYKTSWNGDGLYELGYNHIMNYKPQTSDFEVCGIVLYLSEKVTHTYQLGDNTAGTVEFIFPDTEVPEPSSLLALAFGGAGTALAIRKRKQR